MWFGRTQQCSEKRRHKEFHMITFNPYVLFHRVKSSDSVAMVYSKYLHQVHSLDPVGPFQFLSLVQPFIC
jgi:hypothetical protein